MNPYLACAALLAAGLDGIEKKMELEPEMKGDMYAAGGVREIPQDAARGGGPAARLGDAAGGLR